jgi:hypothetical protein
MGYGATGHVATKQQTDAAPQGWMFLDFVVGTSQVTQPLTSNFALGFSRSENIEAYLALPYAYIPAAAAPGIVLEKRSPFMKIFVDQTFFGEFASQAQAQAVLAQSEIALDRVQFEARPNEARRLCAEYITTHYPE